VLEKLLLTSRISNEVKLSTAVERKIEAQKTSQKKEFPVDILFSSELVLVIFAVFFPTASICSTCQRQKLIQFRYSRPAILLSCRNAHSLYVLRA
jgi:hypothetical protein